MSDFHTREQIQVSWSWHSHVKRNICQYYPELVNRVAIVTQYTLQSLRSSGCSGASRRGAAEYWAWDRRVAGRRRGCWWREGGVPRCSGTPTPSHVSSIPPTRVLSCNPFHPCPPLRDPQTRIYITRLSQTGPWPSSLYTGTGRSKKRAIRLRLKFKNSGSDAIITAICHRYLFREIWDLIFTFHFTPRPPFKLRYHLPTNLKWLQILRIGYIKATILSMPLC